MLSEKAQMSQDLSEWSLKFLNVSLSEEKEQSQLAHDMLQSLSWKMTYKNSFKDTSKFISAKKKCIFWKLMPVFWLRGDVGDKGKLNLSVHNSSREQSSLAASCSGNGYCSCSCGLHGAQKSVLRSQERWEWFDGYYHFTRPERILKLEKLITFFTFFAARMTVISVPTASGDISHIKPKLAAWKWELWNADCQEGQPRQTQFREY